MARMTIKDIAARTEDSYSFDRYGLSGWRGAIQTLRRKGLNDEQIEAFLRSKHMRWAGDMDSKRSYGHLNGQTVHEYLIKYPQYISEEELTGLVEGTI